jgi:glutamate synthase (NADPH/NADH) small chain
MVDSQDKTPGKRQPPREQDPRLRIRNFEEVSYCYTPEEAVAEAKRCLQCRKPQCVAGCPVNVDIPAFLSLIVARDFVGAARKIKETNSLPAVCGRVCPQETQCEARCIVRKFGDPLAIGRLERFVADYERMNNRVEVPEKGSPTGKRVAVIGGGPAGLTCAGDLAKLGHEVTIFEALHKAGGVLVYGIPEFRLPKKIVEAEIDYVKRLGVAVKLNYVVGRIKTIDGLFREGYDAVFVGTGAGFPYFMGIEGEHLNGVYSSNEYLTRSNLMKAYLFPEYDTPLLRGKRVVVVGGGNVALDSVRTALRLGAEQAMIIYRRGKEEMPARIEEIGHAEEEGVQFRLLTNPVRFLGNKDGWLTGVACEQMELGGPDASGRRRPIPVAGSEFIIECDVAVVAIGNGPNPLLLSTVPGLHLDKRGAVIASPETQATSIPGVFAGGDIVSGAATVIWAMGEGKKAAAGIHQYITAKR